MSFKARLTRLQSRKASGEPTGHTDPEPESIRNRLAGIRPQRLQGCASKYGASCSPQALAELVNGDELCEGLIRINESLPLDAANLEHNLTGINRIPPLPGESEPEPCAYIDTETTGLSDGSGTIAFLVGLAYVDNQALNLTQYLITSFSAESRMLAEIESTLPTGYRLASYNGKSFDIPLLQTRYRMKGIRSPFGEGNHLDLLHPIRRLFKNKWKDCRLATAERELLGFHRCNDLPGSEAPDAWFNFMRYGKTDKLVRTIEHNRQDIISLPLIHHALASSVSSPDSDKMDITALATWLTPYDPLQAQQLLNKHQSRLANDGKLLLAKLLIKNGNRKGALSIWERLAQHGCQESLKRLAIYHEHHSRDLSTALAYCSSMNSGPNRDYRLRRLLSKIHKKRTPRPVHDLIGNSVAEAAVDSSDSR